MLQEVHADLIHRACVERRGSAKSRTRVRQEVTGAGEIAEAEVLRPHNPA